MVMGLRGREGWVFCLERSKRPMFKPASRGLIHVS